MGRAVVTKGHSGRRMGRNIRRLEASVELSSKEASAKKAEQKHKEQVRQASEDSPVQNLRSLASEKQDPASS